MAHWLVVLVTLVEEPPKFGSKHTHGSSQPFLTPVPRGSVFSSDLLGHQAHLWCTYIQADKIFIDIK